MHIMSVEHWKSRTYISALHARSDRMKAIDKALQSYHQRPGVMGIYQLKQAIEAWMASQGPEWQDSKRNKNNAIGELYEQVLNPDGVGFSPEEREALKYMNESHKDIARRLFTGAQLSTKKLSILSFANSVRGDLSTARKGAEAAGIIHSSSASGHSSLSSVTSHLSGAKHLVGAIGHGVHHGAHATVSALDLNTATQIVHDLIHHLVDAAVVVDMLRELVQPLVMEIAHTIAPYIGMARSGARGVSQGLLACRDVYRKVWTAEHQHVLLPGSASAAFEAMQTIINRELARHSFNAVVSTTDAVVRGALIAADYGAGSQAIVGGVTALVNVTQLIFLAGRDYYERYQANKVLGRPEDINLHIFETHPILGCYLLTSADTSALLKMVKEEFGQIGWMGDVESEVKKHILPLQELATGYIDDCRFELLKEGKPYAGAFYRTGFIATKKQAAVRKIVATTKSAIGKDGHKLSSEQLRGISSRG